jgi:hypothetical protein
MMAYSAEMCILLRPIVLFVILNLVNPQLLWVRFWPSCNSFEWKKTTKKPQDRLTIARDISRFCLNQYRVVVHRFDIQHPPKINWEKKQKQKTNKALYYSSLTSLCSLIKYKECPDACQKQIVIQGRIHIITTLLC